MAARDEVETVGRSQLSFSNEGDIDEFVETLNRYETGDITADDWRRFRLLRGTYGQRQDDVQMMRIKIPQGIVTGDQLRALGDVAAKYSRGFGHVTTRQNIQYHFVQLKDAEQAMRDLAGAGMTTREACGNSVRNITACPYAGVAHDEVFDVTPYAEGMTRYFLGHPLAGSLPRKFKIAFEGCPTDHALASIHDLGWFARIVGGTRGFRLTIGGGTSILPTSGYLLYEFLPAEQILEVAEAIVRVYHRLGDYQHRQRNRMKFLIRQLGWDAWRERFDETLAEVRAEGGVAFDARAAASVVEDSPDWVPAAAPSVEQVSRLARSVDVHGPGIMPGTVTLRTMSDAYLNWMRANVGLQRQEGFVHVTVRLPLGDMTAGQMHVLADLAEAYGDGTARLTIGQNVLYRWVKSDVLEELHRRLEAAGLGAADANTLADVVSCPGAESCRLAVTQSRGLGRVLTEYLDSHPEFVSLVRDGDIKISGCPNGCGQHHIAAIGFQGSVRKVGNKALPQYFVSVGGGTNDEGASFGRVVSKIPVHRLTTAVERLLGLYKDQRDDGESLGAFFRRVAPETATNALSDLARMAPDEPTAEDFVDLGETSTFEMVVMEGECAS
ncbi:MAG: nitrite/sulfite reductase [Acidobacteria bacterium]|nr:nitrite/sulfite reductase [Acidobacteriota bacterium]